MSTTEIHRIKQSDGRQAVYERHDDGTVTRRVEVIRPDAPDDGPVDLGKLTVKELRTHAAQHGIDLGEATKKPDIVRIVEAGPIDPTPFAWHDGVLIDTRTATEGGDAA